MILTLIGIRHSQLVKYSLEVEINNHIDIQYL